MISAQPPGLVTRQPGRAYYRASPPNVIVAIGPERTSVIRAANGRSAPGVSVSPVHRRAAISRYSQHSAPNCLDSMKGLVIIRVS